MISLPRLSGAVALVLLLARCDACGEADTTLSCPEPGDTSPRVVYGPPTPYTDDTSPFPSDVMTRPEATSRTGLRLDYGASVFAPGLNTLDGFGVSTLLLAEVDGAIDVVSLPGDEHASTQIDSSVFLMRFDDLPEPSAEALQRRLVPLEVAYSEEPSILGEMEGAIVARPTRFLAPQARYAFVVTSCVSGIEGDPLAPSFTFRKLRDGEPVDERLEAARPDLEALFEFLERAGGVARGSITLATVFSTMSVTEDIVWYRDTAIAQARPVPTITKRYPGAAVDGSLPPELLEDYPGLAELMSDYPLEDYRFDAVEELIFGTFEAPRYLDDEDLLVLNPTTGALQQQGTEALEFILTLPRIDPSCGIESPFPVVVFQHASIVCKETVIAVADTLARFGLATIGIDSVAHGSRSVEGYGSCETDMMESFFDIWNFARTNARFLQSLLEQLVLVDMLKSEAMFDVLPAPSGDGIGDLDVSHIGFLGQSMGAYLGLMLATLSPHLDAAVINVGGGVISNMFIGGMTEGTSPSLQLRDLSLFYALLFLGAQNVMDKLDPAVLGQHTLGQRLPGSGAPVSVLYQAVVGDEVFPNLSTEITARAMGIPMVAPVLTPIPGLRVDASPVENNMDGVTAGLYQFGPPAEHAVLLESSDPATMRAVQLQAAIFLSTSLEGSSVIADPYDTAQIQAYLPSSW